MSPLECVQARDGNFLSAFRLRICFQLPDCSLWSWRDVSPDHLRVEADRTPQRDRSALARPASWISDPLSITRPARLSPEAPEGSRGQSLWGRASVSALSLGGTTTYRKSVFYSNKYCTPNTSCSTAVLSYWSKYHPNMETTVFLLDMQIFNNRVTN